MARPTIIVTGDKKIDRMLSRIVGKEGKAAVRKAARAAMKPVLAESRRTTPADSGRLRRSLAVRAQARSRASIGVRVTTKEGMFKGDAFYGGFVEWGWTPRGSRTKVEGQHFLLQAANTKEREAVGIFTKSLLSQLEQLARRG